MMLKKMFEEADEKEGVAIPLQLTRVYVIEIEDQTNETSPERKSEINTVDVNDKLQLNKIEMEKVIVINSDDRNTYKKMFNINFDEENIFTLLQYFGMDYKNTKVKERLLIYSVIERLECLELYRFQTKNFK
jgi:hypothetical protein